MSNLRRRQSVAVNVGGVKVGGDNPIVVQSMTNTDTVDVEGTALQVEQLARAGSELVRVTVNTRQAAAAVPTSLRGWPSAASTFQSSATFTTTGTSCSKSSRSARARWPNIESIPATSGPASITTRNFSR